jgi:hypothetical protein
LQNWWPEYLKFVKEKNEPPEATQGFPQKGAIVGLTYFPDSIPFARDHIVATNVNLLGNTLSPVNSTNFFFLNSTGATQLNIIDNLLKNLLDSYVKNDKGQFDEDRFNRILKQLKNVYSEYVAESGGQLAQIFIKKDIAPEVAYLSWNGGEPYWFKPASNNSEEVSDTLVYKTKLGEHAKPFPPNIFWLDQEQKNQGYFQPNIVDVMNDFVMSPKKFDAYFPVFSRRKVAWSKEIILGDSNKEHIYQFMSRDMQQARLLPNPQYFTDENITGVRIFTFQELSDDKLIGYDGALYQIIRSVFDDFLANAKSEKDFKEGNYELKNMFINGQK